MIRGLHCFQCRGGAYQDTGAILTILIKPGSVRVVSSCWCWQKRLTEVFENCCCECCSRVAGDSGTGDQVTTSNSDTALLTSQLEEVKYLHTTTTTSSSQHQGETFKKIRKRLSTFTFPILTISYWTFLACSFDIPSEVVWCGGGMFVLPMVLMVLCQRPLNISTWF